MCAQAPSHVTIFLKHRTSPGFEQVIQIGMTSMNKNLWPKMWSSPCSHATHVVYGSPPTHFQSYIGQLAMTEFSSYFGVIVCILYTGDDDIDNTLLHGSRLSDWDFDPVVGKSDCQNYERWKHAEDRDIRQWRGHGILPFPLIGSLPIPAQIHTQ